VVVGFAINYIFAYSCCSHISKGWMA